MSRVNDYFEEHQEFPDNDQPPGVPSIQEMIDVCLDKVPQKYIGFIESLSEQYYEKMRLTPKQVSALQKFYFNAINS